ncbi:phage tail protein [Bacteroides ovatus]|uniref:phage tail protein n=1 Tax=Bacteroides ovatus TaxID=28116 RepID=UPI0022E37C10|nr:phage tail protein [Bacteroides ovatus]
MESVDIKDISGNIRFSTPINEGSKRHFLLMQEDYITLLFSLFNPVYFKLGDYVDNELGIFELVDLYKPTYNTTTGAYDYELRLDAYYWKWKNKKFFYTPETTGREAAWNLTATLDTHLKVFLDNLKALGYKFREEEFTYEIDSTVENTSKLVSYDNVNLIDALTQMAETWECEWWITEHVIHFGRCEYSSPVDFKAGDLTDTENVNVNSMTRSDSQTTYATRIYAFGSTRNIPSSYRKDLIFDVKEVNGRNISDTSRPLKINYFPSRVTYKEDYTASSNEGSGPFTPSYTEWTLDKTLASSAKGGSYKVVSEGISINISTAVPQIGNRALLPAGDYILKASYIYNVSGESKEVIIGNQTVSLAQNQQYEIVSKIQVSDTLVIDKNSSDLKVRVYVHVPAPASSELLSTFQAYVTYDINVYGGSSATTSVTFLSGANAGQTFAAVYNPDLLTGDAANIIQLLEGVTASLGNRYTINNIISGKVPDNYFSKDDKEMTLNGVVQKRLMLPEGISYVDAYKYSPTGERINIGDERYNDPDNVEMPEEEAIEEIVIFEDEYPQYKGTISSVSHDDKVDDNDKEYRIYNFKDTGLKNFTEDFRLDGEELHMIFQTGKLAGMDFAINIVESDNTGTTFEIVRNEDYGRFLPDDVLYPEASNTYILYGFDTAYISEQMLPDAEQNLLKKAKEYVKKSMIDPSTYDCEMDADFIYNKGNIRTYEVGDKVNLINKAFFPEGRQSRIIGFEWPLDIPYDHPIYTVGETASYSRIGEIESKLDSLTYKGQTYSGSAVGGGGISVYVIGVNDKTIPSDRNVFSAKRVLQEIIAYAISKTKDDTALGLISFLNGINVTKGIVTDTITATELSSNIVKVLDKLTANNAAFSGNISSVDYAEKLLGWLITPSGDIDAKSLRLRDFLEVPELRYNRVSVITGEEWNAPGGGIIESVDEESSIVYLKLEPGEVAAVEVDDICKANFNNDTGFQTTYFRITEKLDNGSFKYVLRSGYTYHPQKAMHFVCYGNFTNAERQKSSYSTQNYIRFLKGVNNWEITKDMIAMQLGDLSNLKLFGMDMTGHSAYLNRIYMTGTIKQISNDGVTEVPVPVFKGEWKSGTYWYYDEVTHNGSTWICIESTTTQEPSDSSTDWLKVISKGEDGQDGQDGKDGKGVQSVDVLYYLSSSSTSLSGGSWSTNSPTWVDGKYIWSKTKVVYTDGSSIETNPACITGGKGNTGDDGRGISSIVEEYYLSTSSNSLVGGSWSTTPPTWENGKYIWTRSVITYTDSTSTTTNPICSTGSTGETGIGVKSVAEQYYLSTSYSTPTGGSWQTSVPAWQDGKYIWTRVVITYTNNTYTETDPVCVTGEKGPSGNDGVGISAVDVLFYLSTSSSSLEGGAWSTTSPKWEDGKYLWTKTKVTYTNGSTWESDPACITGSQGKTGLPGAMLRPRGVWKANTEYYNNETFIDTVIYDGQNKLCKITHTSTTSFDSTKWEEFSEFENIATNVLLAQNATIDVLGSSGIFVGNLDKTKGWIMTEGSIKHNVTGVELTSDGKISLPETGGINVGGKTFIEAGKIKTEFIDVDNLTVKKLAAVEGTIAGFKISDTHIGVDDPNHNNAYEGLSLYKDFIKFSDEKSWAGIGTNVFPLSSGMSCLGRFDFTSSEVDSGTAVYAKFRPAVDDLGWSQQTAIQYDGNIYGIGQRAIFEDGYIGQAYTDVLTTFIKRTHNFVFNGQSVVNLGMVLPGRSNLGINNDVSFLLSIVITWNPTTAHRITLKGSSDGRLLNNAGEVLSPELDSNGAISLGRGNTLLLRYCSSHYYIVSYRYQ